MKKLSIMILLLLSITLAFVGCGNNEEKLCKDIVRDFTVEMYNESCDKLEKSYSTDSSVDVFKEYFTDEGFDNFINDKTLVMYHNYLIENKKNIVFFDISFNDITQSIDAINMKFTVSFNLMNKNGTIFKELEDELSVSLTPINGQWKINNLSMASLKTLDER